MTLSAALDAERRGLGAIRFLDGVGYFIPGASVRYETTTKGVKR